MKLTKRLLGIGLACVLTAGALCGCDPFGMNEPIDNPNSQNPEATAEQLVIGRWHDRITDETIGMREDGTCRGNKKVNNKYKVLDEQTIRLDKTELSFTVKGDFMAFYNEGREVTPPDYCVRVDQTAVTEADLTGKWTCYGDPEYLTVDGDITFHEDGTAESTNAPLPDGAYRIENNEAGNNMLHFDRDGQDYETEIVAAAGEMVLIDPQAKEIYFMVRAD